MRHFWQILLVWGASLWATAAVATPAAGGAVFGVVPSEEATAQGLEVAAVAPGSPAEKGGLQAGDVLLAVDGKEIRTRSDLIAAILAHKPGDTVEVNYVRDGQSAEARVLLAARKKRRKPQAADATDPGYKEHGDRMVKLLNISPELLEQMRALKREIRHSMAGIAEEFAPQDVSKKLQQLRDLARDAQAHRHGWMKGRACEAYLQFHDEAGTLVLHGANNQLTLEVYDTTGKLQQKYPLNTTEERAELPAELVRRLQELR